MKRRMFLVSLVIAFCLSLSGGTWAADFGQQSEVEEIIVDKEQNTLTYVFHNDVNKYAAEITALPQYTDVPDNAWYKLFVSHLSQLGVINGTSATEFSPNENVTRAEYAKMVTYAAEVDLTNYNGVTGFADVPSDAWYAPSIQWASENGIIEGIDESTFAPNEYITREAASAMLYRMFELQESDIIIQSQGLYRLEAPEFSDEASISPWAEESIEQLKEATILGGNDAGEINPQNNITRSEAAKLLSTYITLNTRPTLITEAGEISYLGVSEEEKSYIQEHPEVDDNRQVPDIETVADDSENLSGDFHLSWWANYLDKNNDYNPDYPSTHQRITERGFKILFADKSSSISNLGSWMGAADSKYSARAQKYVLFGSVLPDKDETDHASTWHYYKAGSKPDEEGRGKNILYRNAYNLFNDHYWEAIYNFNTKRDYKSAYLHLGRSIHYLSDINQPYHANLRSNNDTYMGHKRYERWIDDNWGKKGWETQYNEYSAGSAYSFMTNTSTLRICNNFSQLAIDAYGDCSKGFNFYRGGEDPSAILPSVEVRNNSKPHTREQLKRNQRAVAGFLYAYLYQTGRD